MTRWLIRLGIAAIVIEVALSIVLTLVGITLADVK